MSKRSRCVSLSLMAAPFLLSACSESVQVPEKAASSGPTAYESVDACIIDGRDASSCQAAFEEARSKAVAEAPRFATGADCELEFQSCQPVPAPQAAPGAPAQVQQAGGGSFMPILAGFMIGRSLSNNSTSYNDRGRRSSAGSSYAPLYRSRQGSLAQVNPSAVGGKAYATTPVTARTVTRANVTQARAASAKASSSRSARASRGGFGGRGGGFGG